MKIRRADLERLYTRAKEIHDINVEHYARAVKAQSKLEPRTDAYNSAAYDVKWHQDRMDKSALAVGDIRHAIACLDDLEALE